MILHPGDNITCFLPKFTLNSSRSFDSTSLMNVHIDASNDIASAYYDAATFSVHAKVNGTISHGGQASFSVSGLNVPYYGVNVSDNAQITCGAAASATTHQSLSANLFNFSTIISSFQEVGYFWSSGLDFAPKVAGEETRITLTFDLNSALAAGETVSVFLPGFILSSSTSLAVYAGSTTPIR